MSVNQKQNASKNRRAQLSFEALIMFALFVSIISVFISLENSISENSREKSATEIAKIRASSFCLSADFLSRDGKHSSEIVSEEYAVGISGKNSAAAVFGNVSATANCLSGLRIGKGIEVETSGREYA